MSYEEFVSAIKKEVEELVRRDMRVELHTAVKNNGKELRGLTIREESTNIAPAIYLDDYYQEWKKGTDLLEIARKILVLYYQVCYQKPWDVSDFHIYDTIKSKLACKLINYEQNKKLLEDTPHVRYLDLAIVFYLLVEFSEYGKSSMLVKETHRKTWEVTLEQLYSDSMTNVEVLLPSTFQTMQSVIQELLENEEDESDYEERKDESMYVLTNTEKFFGAICFLYKEKLKEIGGILKRDFYILPSSIHEVIIVSVDKVGDREELDFMINEINKTQVVDEEVLSDHAYFYDYKEGILLY